MQAAIRASAISPNNPNEQTRGSPRPGWPSSPIGVAMRAAETKTATQATDGEGAVAALHAMLDRIAAERTACEKLGDPQLAQRAGRKLLTAVACAADAVLADVATLQSAPEKLAAFLDKSATACMAAIEGLHKRAMLTEAAGEFTRGSRAADPRRGDYPPWG